MDDIQQYLFATKINATGGNQFPPFVYPQICSRGQRDISKQLDMGGGKWHISLNAFIGFLLFLLGMEFLANINIDQKYLFQILNWNLFKLL